MEKGFDKIRDLVKNELADYGFFEYKETTFEEEFNDEYFYEVDIYSDFKRKINTLRIKYNLPEDIIYIDLGEDAFEELDSYTTNIKHFWMALLDWN